MLSFLENKYPLETKSPPALFYLHCPGMGTLFFNRSAYVLFPLGQDDPPSDVLFFHS